MVRPRILPRDPVVAPPRGVSRELGGVGGDAIRGLELGDRLGLLLMRVVRHLPQTTRKFHVVMAVALVWSLAVMFKWVTACPGMD